MLRGRSTDWGLGTDMNHSAGRQPEPPPRCPFAGQGLDSEVTAACPGYAAETVDFSGVRVPGDYPGRPPRPRGAACGHMVAARSERGMRLACGHPDGLPLLQPAARKLVGRPWDGRLLRQQPAHLRQTPLHASRAR